MLIIISVVVFFLLKKEVMGLRCSEHCLRLECLHSGVILQWNADGVERTKGLSVGRRHLMTHIL